MIDVKHVPIDPMHTEDAEGLLIGALEMIDIVLVEQAPDDTRTVEQLCVVAHLIRAQKAMDKTADTDPDNLLRDETNDFALPAAIELLERIVLQEGHADRLLWAALSQLRMRLALDRRGGMHGDGAATHGAALGLN